MTDDLVLLAIDLGAESGRAVLGFWDGSRLEAREVHRFPNEPVLLRGMLYWDLPRLLQHVVDGVARAGAAAGGPIHSIAVDSWGVDFGILDRHGQLLANPLHYRNPLPPGAADLVSSALPRERLFAATGVQPMEINTIYQLAGLRVRAPELLELAGKVLPIAALVSYFLCDRPAAEVTLASTTGMLAAGQLAWCPEAVRCLGLAPDVLPDLVASGTPLGPLREDITARAGLRARPVIVAGASHDTAAAVAAVPVCDERPWAFISSGTWSIVGRELDQPLLGREAFDAGFTNEAGVHGRTRFLRNLTGLWLVQECRRQWASEGMALDYVQLTRAAAESPPATALIDTTAADLVAPGDMPSRIAEACRRSGQPAPQGHGPIVRCVLESLARAYAQTLGEARRLAGVAPERVHVVGGGSQNQLLNELTSRATGLPVHAGPVEATALGNILVQLIAAGAVRSLGDARAVILRSTSVAIAGGREA